MSSNSPTTSASAHSEGGCGAHRAGIDPLPLRLSSAPRRLGRILIAAYRYTLSPLVGFDCRHLPTCSAYADEAIGRFGLWAGGWMTLARLCRCQPWGTSGLDLVPDAPAPKARWYAPWRYARWRGTNSPVTRLDEDSATRRPAPGTAAPDAAFRRPTR